ncbi:SusC/RagA family TonB-linked outer membrane protein [Sediminibacterium soli]|uniref:SusC/RagA family TonB-linked outer membrane protein n=1 Tax=Sediminibacterium soli TaxID=2698829 RepID=UPI001379B70A|nr:SusC/RagA family TonB-linked outer membrane protein [Sediminibacterium soli]NCI47389.1 SusC/RagA family TonB-linked outer membrane protein [Sediminibacterium soli]
MYLKLLVRPTLVGLFACVFALLSQAQNKTITGKVTDVKDGSPLVGVSVVAKGSKTGTQTGADGSFRLSVPSATTTLVFSSVGFGTQEMNVQNSTTANVALTATNEQLGEVVVIGYGTTRKRDLTGAVTSVKAKDFNTGVITAPDQLIQGKVAGLQVINNSGAPGGATTVRIRGNNSVRSGNSPLFVIDGIPLDGRNARPGLNVAGLGSTPDVNPLYFYNPNDIASMDVLKDASGTAIYGSRGANGVIMITTKRGQAGAPRIDLNYSLGFSKIRKKYNVLSGDQYRAALKSYGLTGGDLGTSVDATDQIFQTAITHNVNLGMSGGSENGKYRMSFGYMNQEGILKRTGLKKYTFNMNGQYKFLESRKLSVDFNVLAAHNTENIGPISNDAGFTSNIIGMALQWNPTQALRKADGSLNIIPGSTTVNPLAMQQGYNDKADVTNLFGTVGVGYKLTDDLEYKFNFSLNHQVGVRRATEAAYITLTGIENRGFAGYLNNELTAMVLQHTLNYSKQISSGLSFTGLAGYEYQKFSFKGNGITALDFTSDQVSYTSILQNSSQTSRQVFGFEDPSSSLQSYFARAIFNYRDKYLVTGTFRADGSSKFGSNNKYGYFPSVAAAWNISNEDFLKGNNTFSNLKLRASWGITGNQAFPAGSAQAQYTFRQGSIALANVANPDLKWESTKQYDIGIDFELFGGRVFGTVDYFNKNTTDILFNFDAIQPAPATKYWINLPGNVINKGIEVTLGAALVRNTSVTWNASVNAAFMKNEMQNYKGPAVLTGSISGQGLSGASIQRLASGQPLNAFYLKRFDGLDASGNSVYGDNGNTLYYIGNPNPKTLLGISSDVTWKKWTLVANLNGAMGHMIYNNTLNAIVPIGNLGTRNIAASLIGGPVKESLANPITTSSRYLEKGDYLKLANLSLSYRVGNMGKNIKNVNVFFTAQNLFVITKYSGFDPEVNTDKNIGGVPSLGIEYIPYPSSKSFLFGLNFGL